MLYAVFPPANEPKTKCTEEEEPSCKRFIECKKCGFCQFWSLSPVCAHFQRVIIIAFALVWVLSWVQIGIYDKQPTIERENIASVGRLNSRLSPRPSWSPPRAGWRQGGHCDNYTGGPRAMPPCAIFTLGAQFNIHTPRSGRVGDNYTVRPHSDTCPRQTRLPLGLPIHTQCHHPRSSCAS